MSDFKYKGFMIAVLYGLLGGCYGAAIASSWIINKIYSKVQSIEANCLLSGHEK